MLDSQISLPTRTCFPRDSYLVEKKKMKKKLKKNFADLAEGDTAEPLTCDRGLCQFSAWNRDPQTLIAGCCTASSCWYLTTCVDSGGAISTSLLSTRDVLTWYALSVLRSSPLAFPNWKVR